MYIPTEDKVLEMTPTDFEKYSPNCNNKLNTRRTFMQ